MNFDFNKIAQATIEEPVQEIAAAKAAGKCGDCYACCAGYHEQCDPTNEAWLRDADQAQADAIQMNENMRKYGTIDVPKETNRG